MTGFASSHRLVVVQDDSIDSTAATTDQGETPCILHPTGYACLHCWLHRCAFLMAITVVGACVYPRHDEKQDEKLLVRSFSLLLLLRCSLMLLAQSPNSTCTVPFSLIEGYLGMVSTPAENKRQSTRQVRHSGSVFLVDTEFGLHQASAIRLHAPV